MGYALCDLMFFFRRIHGHIGQNQDWKNKGLNQADDYFQKHKRYGQAEGQ